MEWWKKEVPPLWTEYNFSQKGFSITELKSYESGSSWGFIFAKDTTQFLTLHTESNKTALSWEGNIKLSDFPKAAFNRLPVAIINKPLLETTPVSFVQANAFLQIHDETIDPKNYNLLESNERNTFVTRLETSDKKNGFVRTDIHALIDNQDVEYSFTASSGGELGLQMKGDRKYSPQIVDFILSHNAHQDIISQINPRQTALLLNTYARRGKK